VPEIRFVRRPADRRAGFVIAAVGILVSVPPEALRAASRGSADIAFARQVAIYLLHTRLKYSYVRAGAAFGRDRTTAAHACRTVEERREDGPIDQIVDYLEQVIDLWPLVAAEGSRAA
jgi:chromosomal replication initiation ATPase DnaA